MSKTAVADLPAPAGCGIRGEGCRFLRPGAFHIPVMALPALPTGCSTEIGDNAASIQGEHGYRAVLQRGASTPSTP
jgi:hypothetical protein